MIINYIKFETTININELIKETIYAFFIIGDKKYVCKESEINDFLNSFYCYNRHKNSDPDIHHGCMLKYEVDNTFFYNIGIENIIFSDTFLRINKDVYNDGEICIFDNNFKKLVELQDSLINTIRECVASKLNYSNLEKMLLLDNIIEITDDKYCFGINESILRNSCSEY